MAPNPDPIAEIKIRLDIVDVIGQKVALKKTGHTFKGLCPFHSEKTPSFIVFPDKGNYHCFGCGANGDVFTFTMKTEGLDFPETLRVLAQRAGVELKQRSGGAVRDDARARLLEWVEQAALFYQQALRRPDGKAARDYLERRGITAATIDSFRLGWAPDRWDALSQHLLGKGAKPDQLVAAGLVGQRDDGSVYDRFRGRVIFPIANERGELVGFGGRTLGDGEPKYLNSPQSELFDKGGSLYGIDQARTTIRAQDQATIVEGYVDVLIAHQSGIKDVIASLGTALTERQVSILKRLTRTLVLALDADSAGDEAVLRGLDVAREVYSDAKVPVPLPQGLVRLESRLDANILIAALPRGRDPDEIIREDPQQWQKLVDGARPVVDFYFDVVLGKADLSSTKSANAAVKQLLPIVGEVRDPVLQRLYLQRLADRVRIAEQLLESELARLRLVGKQPARADKPAAEEPRRHSRFSLDEQAIALLLLYPAQARPFADEIREDYWDLVESRQAFAAIRRRLGAGEPLDRASLSGELAEPIADWVEVILRRQESEPTLDERTVTAEQEKCLREMRRRLFRARVQQDAALLQDLESGAEVEARQAEVVELCQKVKTEIDRIFGEEQLAATGRVWTIP